jgi:phenylpropionate dioxygenase-like ring-hydroxylating dioxygenase large terminal subunit
VCRHRGSPVAAGRGRVGRVFSCPYHAWTYDSEGNLLGQPQSRSGFEDLDKRRLGLIPVAVAERFGVIFARPGGTAPIDVEDHLAGLGPELAGFGFENYRFFAERSGVWDMNWKQAIDTFTESYHVFSLHRQTIAQSFLSVPAVGVFFGPHAFTPAMRRSSSEMLEQDESEWDVRKHASIVIRIFPNTVLNLPIDGHAELWEVYPEDGSPHRARISMKFYTPEEPASDKARQFWRANFDLTCSVVFTEDFDAQADIHRGLRAGLQPEFIYGRNEPVLIHFHQHIERALR